MFGFLDLIGAHLDNYAIVHEFQNTQATAMEVALQLAAAPSDTERQAIMAELDRKACDVVRAILLRGVPGGSWIVDALRTVESRFSGAWSGWIREQGPR